MAATVHQGHDIGQYHPCIPVVRVSVPPELVTLVLGHIDEDKATLAQCSLVCRSWFPLAYRYLFRIVNLHKPREGLRDAVDKLLWRLRGAPHVGSYVHELVLTADELAPATHQMLYTQDMHTLFTILSELRVLRISHARFVLSPLPNFWAPPAARKKLSTLALSSISAPPSSLTLAHFIGLFSDIGNLHLDNFSDRPLCRAFLRVDGRGFPSECDASPTVKCISIKNCSPSSAATGLRCLQHHIRPCAVSKLSLHIVDLGALAALDDAVHDAGFALRHLELNLLRLPLSYDTHDLQYEFHVPAGLAASLESVHFTMMVWMHDSHANKNRVLWRCFAEFLSSVVATVREVRITLHTAELCTAAVSPTTRPVALRHLSLLEWNLLDVAASQSPLLDAVRVEIINGDSEDRSLTWMSEEMLGILASEISDRMRDILQIAL